MTADNHEHWDNYYRTQNLDEQKNSPFFRAFLETYRPQLSLPILDVGCGDGDILSILQKSGFSDFYGIDFSIEAIKKCREKFTHDIWTHFKVGELADIKRTFPDGQFGTIISSMSLHQGDYDHARRALQEWNTVLRCRGIVYILTRSNSILPTTYDLVDKNTIYLPRLGVTRVHFTKQSLEEILPATWAVQELSEQFYKGRKTDISAFLLVARKVS